MGISVVVVSLRRWFAQLKKPLFYQPLDLAGHHRIDDVGTALSMNSESHEVV